MHLAAGDTDAYRQSCHELVTRFGSTHDGIVAHGIIAACTVQAGALADMSPLLEIGRVAATSYLGSVRALGAANYRLGRFSEALDCFEEASKYRVLTGWDLAFVAMAHKR